MSKSLENIVSDLIGLFRPHMEGIDSVLDIGTGTYIPFHIFSEHFPGISFTTVDIADIRRDIRKIDDFFNNPVEYSFSLPDFSCFYTKGSGFSVLCT